MSYSPNSMLKNMKTVNIGNLSTNYTTSLPELSDTNHVIYAAKPLGAHLDFNMTISSSSAEVRNRLVNKKVTLINNSIYDLTLNISTPGSEPPTGFPEPSGGDWVLQAYESVTLAITEYDTTWAFTLIENSKLIQTP